MKVAREACMRQFLLALPFFLLALAHSVLGARLASGDAAMLLIAGAGYTRCWLATQILGASIGGYAIAGLATLRIAAPASWRSAAAAAGAASSILLAALLNWHVS
jgi:hypothetical protein